MSAEQAEMLCFNLRQISGKVWAKRKKEQIELCYKGGWGIEKRVEKGIHISVSAPVRFRQVWLQHRYCYHIAYEESTAVGA